jgi:hypothetical protein
VNDYRFVEINQHLAAENPLQMIDCICGKTRLLWQAQLIGGEILLCHVMEGADSFLACVGEIVEALLQLAPRTFDCVSALVAHGADWRPDTGYELTSLRRAPVECEPKVTIDLLEIFRKHKHNVCSAELVHKLLGTPLMKEHLKSETNALLRLGIRLETRPIGRRWKVVDHPGGGTRRSVYASPSAGTSQAVTQLRSNSLRLTHILLDGNIALWQLTGSSIPLG